MVLPGEVDGPTDLDRLGPCSNLGPVPPQSPTELTLDDTPEVYVGKQYEEITKGAKFLYIWGSVIYWDLAGTMDASGNVIQPHVTQFCFEYDRVSEIFKLCEKGNDMR